MHRDLFALFHQYKAALQSVQWLESCSNIEAAPTLFLPMNGKWHGQWEGEWPGLFGAPVIPGCCDCPLKLLAASVMKSGCNLHNKTGQSHNQFRIGGVQSDLIPLLPCNLLTSLNWALHSLATAKDGGPTSDNLAFVSKYHLHYKGKI